MSNNSEYTNVDGKTVLKTVNISSVDLTENQKPNNSPYATVRDKDGNLVTAAKIISLSSSEIGDIQGKLYDKITSNFKFADKSDRISKAEYNGENVDISTEVSLPYGLYFKPDGTKVFVLDNGSDTVYAYDLGTPFDISTAIHSGESYSVNAQDGQPWGLYFKPDGTKMYIAGDENRMVYEYDLGTPFDLSTIVYDNKYLNVAGVVGTGVTEVHLSEDGTKMYISGLINKTIYTYDLGTPFDVTTGTHDPTKDFSTSGQDTNVASFTFNERGDRLILSGNGNDTLYLYDLTEQWNMSTATYSGESLFVGSQDISPTSVVLSDRKIFIGGNENNSLFAYDLPNANLITDLNTNNILGNLQVAGKQIEISETQSNDGVYIVKEIIDANTIELVETIVEEENFSIIEHLWEDGEVFKVIDNGYYLREVNEIPLTRVYNNTTELLADQANQSKDEIYIVLDNEKRKVLVSDYANNVVLISDDNGQTWRNIALEMELVFTSVVALNGDILIFDNNDIVNISTDNGQTWSQSSLIINDARNSIVAANGDILAFDRGSDDVLISSDNGNTWSSVALTIGSIYTSVVAQNGNVLAFDDVLDVVHISTDNGQTWGSISLIMGTIYTSTVAPNGDILVFDNDLDVVHVSTDNGQTWGSVALTMGAI
jgi:6-phosphogluconolactonase (cycloisomerase 2 family)